MLGWIAYDTAREVRANNIPIVLAPHFDGAKSKRIALFQEIERQVNPKTIVILSVNHYQAGSGSIIATAKDWRLADGVARGDSILIERLGASASVDQAGYSFLNEHGINNLLPELYRLFPESKYLAVMIREGTKKDVIDKFYEDIKSQCDSCLAVASVDFSHYVSSEVARKQDEVALQALADTNTNSAWQVKADSPQIVYLITRWATESDWHFQLTSSGNASEEFNTPPADNVSYILGYFD